MNHFILKTVLHVSWALCKTMYAKHKRKIDNCNRKVWTCITWFI